MANSKLRTILALDTEARGNNMMDHGLLSIGWCLGLTDRFEPITAGRISLLPLPGQTYERRALIEFWDKPGNAGIKEELEGEAVPAEDGIRQFAAVVRGFDENYDVYIVSDHPSFDVGFINYYLALYGLPSLSYKTRVGDSPSDVRIGEYRAIYDTDSYARGSERMTYQTPWVDDAKVCESRGFTCSSKATHYPDDDATHIYEMHVKTVN